MERIGDCRGLQARNECVLVLLPLPTAVGNGDISSAFVLVGAPAPRACCRHAAVSLSAADSRVLRPCAPRSAGVHERGSASQRGPERQPTSLSRCSACVDGPVWPVGRIYGQGSLVLDNK